jgi:uncharacterized membrane protein (DUF485 family)
LAATEGTQGNTPPGEPHIDWERAEQSPEFRELVAARRRFVVPATIFFMTWYLGFILLAGYAEDFMGRTFLVEGLTVGYVLALTQFLMVFGLGLAYVRRSERVFDPLSDRAVERALETARTPAPGERARITPAADTGAVSSRGATTEGGR